MSRAKLPTGLLESGKLDSFPIAARARDGEDHAAPYKELTVHDAFAQMFKGVVTA